MRKLIAAINMTLDGYCDHTDMVADDEIHQHYTDMLRNAGTLLYGRITYQLMESYWPSVLKNPTGNRQTDDFALAIDAIPKIVYSRTLNQVGWKNTVLKKDLTVEGLQSLKQQAGMDIFVGSPSLIVAITKLGLIDEYQLCVHPVIAGKGLPLFNHINERLVLRLLNTRVFPGGQVLLCYESLRNS